MGGIILGESMLIEEYLSYLTHVRRQSRNTVRLRETYIRQIASDLDLRTASTAELRTWIAQHRDWSPETVNVATVTMRTFYRWAVETRHVADNPALAIRPVPVPQGKPKVATPESIAAGLSSAVPYDRAFVRLGAECGLRVHEIAKMHTDDRRGEWLTVVGKGGRTRTAHISPELLADLELIEAEQGRGHYFRSPVRAHLTAESVRQRIVRVTGTNPHSLRHRAGTTVYRGTGNNLRLTQVFLGHTSSQTTERYVHIERDDLIAASAAARIAA